MGHRLRHPGLVVCAPRLEQGLVHHEKGAVAHGSGVQVVAAPITPALDDERAADGIQVGQVGEEPAVLTGRRGQRPEALFPSMQHLADRRTIKADQVDGLGPDLGGLPAQQRAGGVGRPGRGPRLGGGRGGDGRAAGVT